MRLNLITSFIGLSILSVAVYAEPPLQAGDTLESLSKVRIQTTINGQPGSIQDLISSGQIQLINEASSAPASVGNPITTPPSALPESLPSNMNSSKAPRPDSAQMPNSTQVPDSSRATDSTEPANYSAPPDPPEASKPVMPGDIIPLPKPSAPDAVPDTLPPINSPVPNQQPQEPQRLPSAPQNPEQPDMGAPAQRNVVL